MNVFNSKLKPNKASCGEGQQVRNRICESDLPLTCEGSDYETKTCSIQSCQVVQCEKIRMKTEMINTCSLSQTQPQCESEPWWHRIHMRQHFRLTGYYHFAKFDAQNFPVFEKKSNDIKMFYNHEATAWVIQNDKENLVFGVSSSQLPTSIDSSNWNIKQDNQFVNANSVNISFTFECASTEQTKNVVDDSSETNGPTWGEWSNKFSYPSIGYGL